MQPRGQATLEVCLDAPDDLALAVAAGVDRIELCSALALGGLTPTPGLIERARTVPIPVYAMIRPRAGDFCYSRAELDQMAVEIAMVREAGLAGVVFGVGQAGGELDLAAMRTLCAAAAGLGKTLHRVVDTLADPVSTVDPAIALGFERILTSGGKDTALEGASNIEAMLTRAGANIEIMAGSGVRSNQIEAFKKIGCRSFHASCAQTDPKSNTRRIDPAELSKLLGHIKNID